MLTAEFDYNLPPELIAQSPLEARDQSRLMVIDREGKNISHHKFFEIVNYLRRGDVLVWNNTKVFKARLRGEILLDESVALGSSNGRQTPAGQSLWAAPSRSPLERGRREKILNAAPVEIFLVRPMENKYVWKVLAKPGKRLRLGMKIKFAPDFSCEVMLKEKDGTVLVQFADDDLVVRAKANLYGEVPTPPYVKNEANQESGIMNHGLSERYQTVYAKHEGSVAAPTAGFHFTPELIEELERRGIEFAEVTLHVGLGTFLPVKMDVVEEHRMHSEWVELTAKNADIINQAKAEGRRVVAVGTTTVRALEGVIGLQTTDHRLQRDDVAVVRSPITSVVQPYTGDINIFITPGFRFQIVDALITNFHLPKSTLLMLVSAFAGDKEFILRCYREAIEEQYRFYSFGDAMLIK